ncbi:MAG TPA: hypothetical protein VMN99_13265 [Anaerolineales bacterium]|nr:hypothetical protein [Anaerolineales bacterium]
MKMKQYKSQVVFLIAATVFLGITFLPLFANERTLDTFAREDGIVENLTAIYLLVTSLLFAAGFFRFRSSAWLLRLSYLGLALLFFLGAGEEISWGERIFGWTEQNFIRERNVQGELTLHNLEYFQGDDSLLPISISQLFIAFTFVFAVLIPLVCMLLPKLGSFVAARFPVMPLYPGLLVVITYVLQKSMLRILPMFPALYQHTSMPIPQGVHEIREHGYTFALLASAIIYFSRERANKAESSRETQGDLTGPSSIMAVRIDNEGDKI